MRKSLVFAGISAVLMVLDFILKFLAIDRLSDSVPIIFVPGIFELVLHRNYGVIANIGIPLLIVILVSIAVIAFLVRWMWRVWQGGEFVVFSALSLVFFGALSNLIDRVVHGFTTDYVLVFSRSVLNIADVMIFVGVALLLVFSTTPRK